VTENNNIDDLLVKVVLGESTAEELSFVRGWRAESPENERYFADFQRIWEESRNLAVHSTVDEVAAWGKFMERVGRGEVSRGTDEEWENRVEGDTNLERGVVAEIGGGRRGQWMLRVAAILIAVMAGGWFFYTYSYKPGQFLSVNSGLQVLSDTLPEGSVVTMNKESSIRYRRRFAGNIRQVEMEGEAFFAVAPDKNKAFVVQTNGVSITVLGTSFNVRAVKGKTEVIVETGLVEIKKGGHVVRVGAHEKAVIGMDDAKLVKEDNPDQLYNYYRTKTFECNGTPMWRLVEKLNEVYKAHITIGNPRLSALQLTTTFVDESLDGILDVVSKTFGITVVHNGQEIILK
jgi:ferric-dicitrate binding protein FerR (iron transport regulator)